MFLSKNSGVFFFFFKNSTKLELFIVSETDDMRTEISVSSKVNNSTNSKHPDNDKIFYNQLLFEHHY